MSQIKKGSVNRSVDVYIIDDTTGLPELGVLFNTAGIDLEYRRDVSAVVDIVEVTLAALTTAWASGGFLEIGHGLYRLDVPNAAFATGANKVTIQGTVTGMIVLPQTIQLVDFDPEDGDDLGLTALTGHVPQTADHTAAIAAIPTTAMRGTDDALTDKAGFSLAATGLDLIASTATGAVALAKAVWDTVLTGGTFNIQNSAGRIMRFLRSAGTYANGLVWLDSIKGFAGTDDFENGTEVRPVTSLANANTVLGSVNLGLHGVHVASSNSITFVAAQEGEEWSGEGWTLAMGGQSINNSVLCKAIISGISTGVPSLVHDCFLNACTWAGGDFVDCAVAGVQTLSAAVEYHFFNAHHASSTPAPFDFGATVGATTLHLHDAHGAFQISNMGQVAGADVLHYDSSGGVLTINASCVGGTLNLSGTFKLVNNGSGQTINLNGAVIQVLGVPVNADISADVAEVKTETALIKTEADKIALADAGAGVAGSVIEEIENRPTTAPPTTAQIRDAIMPTQNAAFNNIEFLFVAASDHVTPVTGATGGAVTRSIDGGAFASGTGTLAEVGNGIYQYDASSADMNGGIITFRFRATGGTPGAPDDVFLTIVTGGGV